MFHQLYRLEGSWNHGQSLLVSFAWFQSCVGWSHCTWDRFPVLDFSLTLASLQAPGVMVTEFWSPAVGETSHNQLDNLGYGSAYAWLFYPRTVWMPVIWSPERICVSRAALTSSFQSSSLGLLLTSFPSESLIFFLTMLHHFFKKENHEWHLWISLLCYFFYSLSSKNWFNDDGICLVLFSVFQHWCIFSPMFTFFCWDGW